MCTRSSTLFSGAGASAGSVLRSSDQLADVVALALELLPPLPEPQRILQEGLPLGDGDLMDIDGPVQPSMHAGHDSQTCTTPRVLHAWMSRLLHSCQSRVEAADRG